MRLFNIKYSKKFPFIRMDFQTFYAIMFQFIVIGVLGFIMESGLEYICCDHFSDRGFFSGPFIPIYGIFVIIICFINIFPKFTVKNFIITSVILFFGISILEESVGVICEKAFDTVLWTYSGIPLSTTYCSFFISLLWGFFGALYLIFGIPFINKIALKQNNRIRLTILIGFWILFGTDIISSIVMFHQNGGYDELYYHDKSTDYTLFLIGLVAYFVAIIALLRHLSKIICKRFPKLDFICLIVSFIMMSLPVFSAFEYLEETDVAAISFLAAAGFVDCAFVIYLTLVFLFVEVALLIYKIVLKIVLKIRKKKNIVSVNVKSKKLNLYFYKTNIFKLCFLAFDVVIAILICFIGYLNVQNTVVTSLSVGSGDTDVKMVAVGDIHYDTIGCVISLDKLADQINELDPDIVFFLGDTIDDATANISVDDFSEAMLKINSTYGIYNIGGNHEYESNSDGNVKRFFAKVEAIDSNFHYLENEEVVIDNLFRVVGRKDYTFGGSSGTRKSIDVIEASCEDDDSSLPLIVLDHQPQDYQDSIDAGAVLQLSGHTHDGQLFPMNLILRALYKYEYNCITYGSYVQNDFTLFVTRGYGTWGFPMRTTGNSEIVDIDFYC